MGCLDPDPRPPVEPTQLPLAFARSLVAIATAAKDVLRMECLEALMHLAVLDPRSCAVVGGFRVLFDAVLDPNTRALNNPILYAIIRTLNDAESRAFVRPHLDLRKLLAPFTDLDSPLTERLQRVEASLHAFVVLMRSCAGLYFLTRFVSKF